jgi:HK97 gp10 family phage protein
MLGGFGFDARSFRRDLAAMRRQVRVVAPVAMTRASGILAARVQAIAPVDTGDTRDSTRVDIPKPDGSTINQQVTVGEGDPREIVGYLEFGTRRMAPRRFFGKAADDRVPRMIEVVRGEIERAMK